MSGSDSPLSLKQGSRLGLTQGLMPRPRNHDPSQNQEPDAQQMEPPRCPNYTLFKWGKLALGSRKRFLSISGLPCILKVERKNGTP